MDDVGRGNVCSDDTNFFNNDFFISLLKKIGLIKDVCIRAPEMFSYISIKFSLSSKAQKIDDILPTSSA